MSDSFKSPDIGWTPDTRVADVMIFLRRDDGVARFQVRRGGEVLFGGRDFTEYGDIFVALNSEWRAQNPVQEPIITEHDHGDAVDPAPELTLF